jgi:hypothetical protein
VIAYFDTSAIVPLLVHEPTTDHCARLWNEATRIVCARLVYPEVDFIEITENLAVVAGRLVQQHGLRGHDAVHLAAGVTIADHDVVFVTGDADLADAATARGLATAVPIPRPT